VTACEQATLLAPDSGEAWARLAHALARTDRVGEALEASERPIELNGSDRRLPSCSSVGAAAPRVLPAA
jgi:cytochrome c-type biogenesis protein CcmH/NrfG